MAGYEATIDLIVRGQDKINRLLSKVESLSSLTKAVSSQPIEFSVKATDQALARVDKQIQSLISKTKSVQDQINAGRAKELSLMEKQAALTAALANPRRKPTSKLYQNDVKRLEEINKLLEEQAQKQKQLELANKNLISSIGQSQKIKSNLPEIQKEILFVNQLADDYRSLGESRKIGQSGQFLKGASGQAVSTAQLSSQVELLKSVAANSRISSDEFRKFVVASEIASRKLSSASRKTFNVLAEAFSAESGVQPRIGGKFASASAVSSELAGARGATVKLIASFSEIAKSQAGLESYREELSSLQRLVPIASSEFIQLAGAIRQVDDILSRVSTRDASKAFGPVADQLPKPIGPATDLVSQGLKERQLYADRKLKVDQNLNRLAERIEDTIGDQGERTRLLVQANQALNALAEDRLEDAARELSIIERQRQAYSRLEKQQVQGKFTPLGGGAELAARTKFATERVVGGSPGRMAVSPISGASRAGIVPGSPADKQRTARARLSWLTFFSQALDVAADQTTAATQDAVKLAQQKTKEIERATAQLWRQFGGPALPPKFGGSSGGARGGGSIGQAFRAGGPGAALASLSSPQRLASQQTSAALLAEKLNNLEIKGVNTTAERKRLQEIVNDLSAKDLQLSDELLNNFDLQLNSIRDYLRLQNQVLANDRARETAAKRVGGGASGGAGTLSGFAGSLQGLQASINQGAAFFGSTDPGRALEQVRQRFGVAGQTGGLTKLPTNDLNLFARALEEIQQNLRPTTAGFDRLNNEITELRTRIGVEQGARGPEAGFLARRRIGPRAGRALSEGLVGGAFPLLFGQGLGASVFGGLGGAAGGFAGGGLGFGLSLVGTGLGTAVDTLSTNIKNLATSLKEPTQALEAMKTAGLRVTPELEDTVKRIEALGFASSAQNLVLKELERQIGSRSVTQLQALNQEQKRLESEWQKLSSVIISAVLPGLIAVTSVISDFTRGLNAIASIKPPQWMSDLQGGIEEATGFKRSDLSLGPVYALTLRNLRERSEAATARVAGTTTGLTPEQQRQQQLAAPEAVLNSLSARKNALELGKQLIDQQRAAQREQEDLDRQRYDLIESYERSIADIRLGVSRRIQQEELNNINRQNEIYSRQGDIRLQQLKNENTIVSESLRGNELGQQLFDIVAQYSEEQLATENEIANRRRSLEAELQSVAIETEQYKADIAKQVNELNLSTAKQIQQIQLGVARKQQDLQQNRFQLEKDIAIAQLRVEEIRARQAKADLEKAYATEKDQSRRDEINKAILSYNGLLTPGAGGFAQLIKTTEDISAPAQVSFAGINTGAGVSTAGFDAVISAGNQLRLRLEELSKALDSLVATGKFNELNSQLMNLADQGMMAAVKEFKELSASLEVLTGGSAGLGALLPKFEALDEAQKKILGSEAVQKSPQKAELEKLIPLYIRLAKVNMQAAETYGFFNSAISENLSEITSLKEEINNLLAGTTAYEQALASLTARGLSPASEEARKLLASAQELDRLRDKAEILNNIRDAATGFSDSLRGLVEQFVELKDAGEAVKAFSEELGKKSLSFVLDLAFKPIEDAMQKQFIAFADMLGVDVRPEELKQLTELQKIESWTKEIKDAIKPIADSLAASQKQAEAEALARAQQQQASSPTAASSEFLNSEGHQKYFSTISRYAKLQLSGYYDEASVKSQAAMYGREQRNAIYADPRYTQEQKDAIYARVISLLEEQEKLRLEAIRKMTGQGGPDTIIPGVDVPPADRNLPSPDALKPLVEGAAGAVQKLPEVINRTTEGVEKSTQGLQAANASWLKGLGQAVTGLAGAAAAAVGIAGGVQQMSDGGTYNTLTGLAGIFGGIAAVAGAAGSLSGAFGAPKSPDVPEAPPAPFDPGAPAAPRAAGGPVLGGSPYLVGEQGPELFIPNGSGMIIPNRSTKVEGSGSPFAATSQQVSANGERAMAANLDNSPIKVESRIINGVEYVTMDQLNEATRRAERRGAERGKSLAISSLQNSVKTRKRVGV